VCGPGQPYGIVIEFAAPILLRYTPGPSTEMSTVAANTVVHLKVTCCGFAGTDDDASGFGTVHDGRAEVAWKLVICTAVDAVAAVVVGAAVEVVVVSGTEVEVLDEVDEVDDVESLVLVVSVAEFELFERVASTMITAATIAASTTAATMSSNLRRPSSPVGPYGPGGSPGPDGPCGATAGMRRVGSPPTDGVSTVGSKSSSDKGPGPPTGGTLSGPMVRRRYRSVPAVAPDHPPS
jgi:hypothetical protein